MDDSPVILHFVFKSFLILLRGL